jgi:glycosyltransferase involved in cell wall biosynthesis
MLLIVSKNAFLKKRTGVEEYTFQLIQHLKKIIKKEPVVIFTNKKEVKLNLPLNFNLKFIKLPFLWTQIGLSYQILKFKLQKKDLRLFIPAHVIPLIHPQKTIVTIHGLEYEHLPHHYGWLARQYLRWSTKYATKKAWKIITPSYNTKKDLISLYHCYPHKIQVIYHGVTKPNYKFKKIAYDYFLYLGRIETKKNIIGIIRAFEIFKKKNIQAKKWKLILAGKPGFGFQDIKKQVLKSSAKKDIYFKGHVVKNIKWNLIKNSRALVFPSFYEGFGLPILEAQQLGIPVIVSNNSSLQEIANAFYKKSAFLVNPNQVIQITKAMKNILCNNALTEKIAQNGQKNAQNFKWLTTAQETFKVLNLN